jgi:hypothetical protein
MTKILYRMVIIIIQTFKLAYILDINFYLSIIISHTAFLDRLYSEGHKVTTTVLSYEYIDQNCKHNGIPLSAHFISEFLFYIGLTMAIYSRNMSPH